MAGLPVYPSPAPSPPVPPLPPSAAKDDDTKGLWYVGAIINVIGSVSINLGMNLIKLGHTTRAQLDMPEEEKPPIRKFKSWIIGIVFFTVGNVLNFVSFAFAAQSLLAALGSLQLVCNVFFAYFVNHEPVTLLIILSTFCIIGGCVILVVFGNQSSETYTVDELIKFYTKPAYVVYLVMMVVFVFGFYVLYLHSKKVCRTRGERGIWYGLMLVSYAVYSAMLGSQSVLFGKSISVILRTTFTESNQLGNWYTWVVLPLFMFTALFYVTRMNKGLRMFPAMIIVPLLQIAWTLFSIVSGMIYFQEYKGFTTLKAVMFAVGVLVVFLGVFVLTVGGRRKMMAAAEEEEEMETEKCADDGSRKTMTVHENAMFSGEGEDMADGRASCEPTPLTQPKMSLGQTLRPIISPWAPASTAVSPGSHMNRTLMTNESMRRQRRLTNASDLNATGRTNRTTDGEADSHGGWKNSTYDKSSTLNRTGMSNLSQTSKMSTMRNTIKGVSHRITDDLGVDPMSGLKMATGFGGGTTPAVSIFAMPMPDFTMTQKRRLSRAPSQATRTHSVTSNEAAILNALPKSKWGHRGDPEGLTTIREMSVAPTAKPTSSDLGNSLTASSQLQPSSLDEQGGPREGGSQTPRAGAGGVASSSGGGSPDKRTGGTSTPVVNASRAKPLEAGALLGMLPGPAFKTGQVEGPGAGPSGGVSDAEQAAGRAGSGGGGGGGGSSGGGAGPARSPRSARLVMDGGPQMPGYGTRPPPTPYDPQGSMLPPPNAGAVQARQLGGYPSGSGGGASQGGSGGGAPNGAETGGPGTGQLPGASRAAGGGLGAVLPEGVPLSGTNSVILHDSLPSTPPDVIMGAGGAAGAYGLGGPGAYTLAAAGTGPPLTATGLSVTLAPGLGPDLGGRSQSQGQGLHRLASPQRPRTQAQQQQQRPPSSPLHQQILLSQQQQQQQQQAQLAQAQLLLQANQPITPSLLQRIQTAPTTGARLPPLHLMVPGMPRGPPPQPAYGLGAGIARSIGGGSGGGATAVLAPPPPSMSYAQMLSGRLPPDVATLAGIQPPPTAGPRGMGMGLASSISLGGARPGSVGGGVVAATPVLVQSRPRSPHGLSVSRSWAGMGGGTGSSGGGAAAAPRQSPLRGSLVLQMQKPLRPWQS